MSTLKRTLTIAAGSLLLLAATLAWHIHAVTKPHANGHLANVQLARIDFATALDHAEAASIRSTVNALPGVQHARMNDARTNLVYSYDRALQDQHRVLDAVEALTNTSCERFVVTAEAAATGCPAMVKGDVGGWLSGLLH